MQEEFMSGNREKSAGKKWKKVVQIVAAYLVAAWTFVQFVDWILIRYQISPYWVDILLWLFLGILPSLVIYVYHIDRLNAKQLKLREKIIFPLNVFVLFLVMYFLFGNSDLGSTTKEVAFTNELGALETQTITKEEFRIGVAIFNFEQVEKDSTHRWLVNGIKELLRLDLDQDKSVSITTNYANNTTDKVKMSSVFQRYYVDGEFGVKDGVYTITPVIRNSKNGREIERKTFTGTDLLGLVDQMSIYLKNHVGIIEEMRDRYIDLSIKDITSPSLEAVKLWIERDYEGAVAIDSTFALAYYSNAMRRNRFSQGELEEKYLIDKAYQFKNRLPTQLQFEILMHRQIIYNRWKDAEELIKYQLEIDPNNDDFNYLLYRVYSQTQNIEGYYQHAKKNFNKGFNESNTVSYYTALVLKGEFKEALKLIRYYELLAPNTKPVNQVKSFTQLIKGDYKDAEKSFAKLNLLFPEETVYKKYFKEVLELKLSGNEEDLAFEQITGNFRSTINEQTIEYFERDDNLFIQYQNQLVERSISIGAHQAIRFHPVDDAGSRHYFERDENDQVYRVKIEQFSGSRITVFHYYKEDAIIKQALQQLKEQQYEEAEKSFDALVQKLPKYWYLTNIQQYLKYRNNLSPEALVKQYNGIVGTYGERKFWVENGRLFYKRNQLAKLELLPISKTHYITLSAYDTQYVFEKSAQGKQASLALRYNLDKGVWDRIAGPTNYFLKD